MFYLSQLDLQIMWELFVCDGVGYEAAPFTEKSILFCGVTFVLNQVIIYVGLIPLVFLYLPQYHILMFEPL